MARTTREKFWERIWASTVVLYTFCATFVVYKELSKYGVNWGWYLIIDVPTSWLYGITSARLVMAVVRRRWGQIQKWGWLAAANFAIPQLYILITARKAPHNVYLIIYSVIAVLVIFALGGIASQVSNARKNLKTI